MIVCVCHAVSDRTIRDAAGRGATAEDIARTTRAGTGCGCCREAVRALVASAGLVQLRTPTAPACARADERTAA